MLVVVCVSGTKVVMVVVCVSSQKWIVRSVPARPDTRDLIPTWLLPNSSTGIVVL